MPEKDAIHLHFNDLKLLMENYQNVVQLNTILLEQQKQIGESQKELLKNTADSSSSQLKVFDKLESMTKLVEKNTNEFREASKRLDDALHSRIDSTEDALHGRFDSVITKIENTKAAVDTTRLDMVTQHSKIINKIYIALVGSGVIILTLAGSLVGFSEKFKILETTVSNLLKLIK